MARMPRVVVPGYPHHVIQRGARRMQTFFGPQDYRYYLRLMQRFKDEFDVAVWAYCLMPNHVHFIAVPQKADGLAKLFSQVHRRYARKINMREDWRGHLWQERFHSYVMDEPHTLAAARYIERNPVAANLCEVPQDWPWSSARAHLSGRDDRVVTVEPMLRLIKDWRRYLSQEGDGATERLAIQHASRTGRPMGSEAFVSTLEQLTGRELILRRPGRKPLLEK